MYILGTGSVNWGNVYGGAPTYSDCCLMNGGEQMETLLAALIAATASIVVSVINNNYQHKKVLAELEKGNALQAFRLEQLEKKVDKHNKVVERTYLLEEAEAVMKEQIKVANHRIEDLEKRDK